MKLLSRADALAEGVRVYNAKVCQTCGDNRRYVTSKGCISCTRVKTQASRARDPAKAARQSRESVARWRAKNPGAEIGYNCEWRHLNADKVRAQRRRNCGLPEPTRPTPPTCECCGGRPGARALHLDHDHETGAFRGWLCGRCNSSIGMLGDGLSGVRLALAYLLRARKK